MITIITFVIASFILKPIADSSIGFVPGYGDTYGIIPGWAATVAIVLVSVSFFIDIDRSKRLSEFKLPIYVAFLWRLFLVFFDRYGQAVFQLPNSGADSGMFYRSAVLYVSTHNPGRGELFSTVMGLLFSFTGASQLYGQFIISLFSMTSICITALTLNEIGLEKKRKRRSLMIIALLPNYAILSSIFLRESIVSMLIAVSLYFFVCWMTRNKERFFLLAFIMAFLSAAFHSGSVAVAGGYIGIRLLYNQEKKAFSFSLRNIIPTMLLIVVTFYLFINYANNLFAKMANIASLADVGSTFSEGGSSYAAYVGNSATPLNMLIYTFPRIFYFIFSPFPWQWRGIQDIIAFVFSSLFYLIVVWNTIIGIRDKGQTNRNYLFAFLIIAICAVFVFAWGTTNTGTATRHREKLIPIFIVLYSMSYKMDRAIVYKFGKYSF